MKKIVGIIGAALIMASSATAIDMAARVYMTGSLAGGTIDATDDGSNATSSYIFQLNAADQKDADALALSANGEKAGANFQFWYKYAGDDASVKIRKTNLWFKPVSMLTVKVGDLSTGIYNDKLTYWKSPVGASIADWDSWGAKYSAFATVEGAGAEITATPIDGLMITAGVTPGTGKSFAEWADTSSNSYAQTVVAYGVGVQYSNIAGLPLSAGVAWRDAGNKKTTTEVAAGKHYDYEFSPKIAQVGFDYGNAYAAGIYAMLNARMRLEQENKDNKAGLTMTGVTLDNYVKYSAGALKVEGRFPVTIRTTDDEGDFSFIDWTAKVSYGLSGCTPYLSIGSDLNNDGRWVFNGDKNKGETFIDSFNLEIKPGVSLNVGSCSVDCAVLVDLPAGFAGEDGKDIKWSLPFELSVGL